ncbi:SAP DNA-binding domain-containing protein [Tieghemostelium lacteum]|uniref:SAP DNA-binding domain-containing protein n=1 Tax=Tieghemostelium lacteum TaxID=361077 RepID=A0A152A686_TIELA|nr:SAP DNA-binding domain-containing protein [Tieghemostelium lacteum]|eukprot:KYR01733.1 SAP DNA-binding domain-containing protein [Tieghemostelium lacteum]
MAKTTTTPTYSTLIKKIIKNETVLPYIKITNTDHIKEITEAKTIAHNLTLQARALDKHAEEVKPKIDSSIYKTALTQQISSLGLLGIFSHMSHETLTILYNEFHEVDKKQTKIFLTKRLAREVLINGVEYFKDLSEATAEKWSDFFECEVNDGAAVMQEIKMMGFEVFLHELPVSVLKSLLVTFGFDLEDFPLNNPNHYVYSIITGEPPAIKEKKPVKKIKFVKTKPTTLHNGLSFQDIFQHFNKEELLDFCKEEEIQYVSSLNKRSLINVILEFLASGKKPQPKRQLTVDESEIGEDQDIEEEVVQEVEEEDDEVELEETEEKEVTKTKTAISQKLVKSPLKNSPRGQVKTK